MLGDNLIATKYALRGVIYIWDLTRLTEQEGNLEVTCSFVLHWSSTDEYHIELAWNKSKHTVCIASTINNIIIINFHGYF